MCEIEMQKMNYVSSPHKNGHQISEEIFSFFQLPFPVQIEIVSLLSWEDTKSFSATSRDSRLLTKEQIVWKKKLWHHSRVINLCLEGRKSQPKEAEFLVKDPLLVDMRKLYEVLNPSGESEGVSETVEREDFLSKVHPPQVMSFSSVGLQELLNFLNTFFHRPPPIFYDPFSRGHNAPSFILFGPPETSSARKLALSFIASKNSVFETVGLVKGKPGGLGGGVTVEFGRRLMNLLPVRRARPRLLVENPSGVTFHPDVAQVVKDVDGLIYYCDAKCSCHSTNVKTHKNQPKNNRVNRWTKNTFENPWQSDLKHDSTPKGNLHPLDNEFYELEAMLKATPDVFPPILVILVHNKSQNVQSSSDSDDSELERTKKEEDTSTEKFHTPSDILHRMQKAENPWMICNVDVHSLRGVRQGINWLYKRTRILTGK